MKFANSRIPRLVLVLAVLGGGKAVAGETDGESPAGSIDPFRYYRATLAAAERALRLDETREANAWLAESPSDLRGWEWRFLDALTDQSEAHAVMDGDVTRIAVSPDGALLAAGMVDGSIRLVALPDLVPVRSILGHGDAVYSVAFSPDGERLVTVSRDATSRVWDLAGGAETCRLTLDNPGVAAAAFAPDGRRIATCTWMMVEEDGGRQVHGVVLIWDGMTGDVLHKVRVGVKPLASLDWSDDGRKIFVGSWDGLVHALADDGTPLGEYPVPDAGIYNAVISVDVSADGEWLACGTKDRTARIWNLQSAELAATLAGHSGFVNEVRFDPEGTTLTTGSGDGTLRVWDWRTGNEVKLMRGHEGSVTAFAGDPARALLYSAGGDRSLRRWSLSAAGGNPHQSGIGTAGTYTTAYSPDGQEIYVACYDGRVRIVSAADGASIGEWVGHEGNTCNTLSLSSDGRRLLTCSWDRTVGIWSTPSGELERRIEVDAGPYDACLSPDGRFAAVTADSTVDIWDVAEGLRIGICSGFEGEELREVRFSPDGRLVAAAGPGGRACVWDAVTMARVATLDLPGRKSGTVAFSPDGRWIATAGTGEVALWRGDDFAFHAGCRIGDRNVSNLAFSPDSRRLAAGSDAIIIIDVERGEPLLRFQPNDDDIYDLAFSPDGRSLASCTAGGSLAISFAPDREEGEDR